MNYQYVDADYIRNRISSGEYPKYQVQKTGIVKARLLRKGDCVKIYYYNDVAEIETKNVEILYDDQVLITKTIDNKEYNSVMSGIKFHKSYRIIDNKTRQYIPVIDPVLAYEVNENIQFENIYQQQVKLCPGDFIIPYDASHRSYYSIYQYNLQDNYELSSHR